MGPPYGHTLTEKLDKKEGIDLEVSGIKRNTDCALPTEEDAQLLEEIQKSKAGKEKGAAINWLVFGESPISGYGNKMVLHMLFPWLYPIGTI
jgi:hypothetical protein